jgi:hypothetical protein
MTRASTRTGRPWGSPKGVTPPISMPVSSATGSERAKDALRTFISRRTTLFTSSDVVARRTQAAYVGSAPFEATRMVFALRSSGTP